MPTVHLAGTSAEVVVPGKGDRAQGYRTRARFIVRVVTQGNGASARLLSADSDPAVLDVPVVIWNRTSV